MAIAQSSRPRVIYGEDNRLDLYQVVDPYLRQQVAATVALIRSSRLTLTDDGLHYAIQTVEYGRGNGLCLNEPFYEQETAAFCSGSLVGPDLILTAGHCIRTQENCDNTRFVFGFGIDDPLRFPRTTSAAKVFSCKELLFSVAEPVGEDFALVRLDRPVPGVTPLSLRASGHAEVGTELYVIGHPAGLPVKVAGGAGVRAVRDKFLVANLDTYGGNSGSAVFNALDGVIEGVLVRGELDYVLRDGCRQSNRCPDTGCRGEDVTLAERVSARLRLVSLKSRQH